MSDDQLKVRVPPAIGDRMPDGTIYAGISPDTNEPIYVMSADLSGTLKWKQAMEYAARLDENGHRDWRLPTKTELDVLFENRDKGALKGTFNESGFGIDGRYWSSIDHPRGPDMAWVQYLGDGLRDWRYKDDCASVRFVRSGGHARQYD